METTIEHGRPLPKQQYPLRNQHQAVAQTESRGKENEQEEVIVANPDTRHKMSKAGEKLLCQ